MPSPEPSLAPSGLPEWRWRRINWWGVALSGSSAGLMLSLVWLLIS